ncbi:sensor histidine kinase KdpD [Viridibacillus sp. FSL R5-0477]|uniref:histidine kinase n=1 Tax=Viridibacillus arenosi FSL R5-213 TaxID=1227360 RepID=W4F3W5_9BACL|nr:sensor histidine kinase KdpD [Viridibacillus arenosi]ETT87533.1 sensor protein [Viridibacillus arenosi FSL R5-213]OMC91208.1 two-component sensor histidine kinase [Viridibacillus arenosi]
MEYTRPNPDAILAKVKRQESKEASGSLKIFLGYAAGVGKTYSMLDTAHQAKKLGLDVVVGYVEPHPRPETAALLDGLEMVPTKKIHYKGKSFEELDIDAVLECKPDLVLVDELAHTNVPTMRHLKRFGDVQELLAKGIHVYTTVNIQHIESLHDLVEEITGVKVNERIPDYLIDNATQIKLVDIEPDDLIQRLKEGKIYHTQQAEKAMQHFFQKANLIALREIALRRTADTIDYQKTQESCSLFHTSQIEEHILVGISSSPTNAKVIRTAARLAQALHGKFTALYVHNKEMKDENEVNLERLQQHIKLTEQLGGHIVTVQEDDVAAALANYAQMSGVTKLVIGRTTTKKQWWKPNSKIGDRLNEFVPNLAMYIVPDQENESIRFPDVRSQLKFNWYDLLKMLFVFSLASLIGLFFARIGVSEANIITIYILGVLILAIWSTSWVFSIISSLMAVLIFNFIFTEPRFSFEAYNRDYPMTFFIMFISGIITSSLTRKVKKQALGAVQKSYRMEVLLETNRKLQQAKSLQEIVTEGMSQVVKLVEKPAMFFEINNQQIMKTSFFPTDVMTNSKNKELENLFNNRNERAVVTWVSNNKQVAGVSTDTFPGASSYYLPVLSGDDVKGVIGIMLSKETPLPAFERHILHAIMNDFSFAIDKWYLQKSNEQVTREAELEQMRANFLRAISHDLRTPLTSISGNADILLTKSSQIDDMQKKQLYQDIYSNSKWLVQMVENLLAVSKLDDGQLAIEMRPELVEDIIQEALMHVVRNEHTHQIHCHVEPDLLFAVMDARLIIQVIINIIDNALTYTPAGSEIILSAKEQGDYVHISISDNGPGIDDALKTRLFEPFTIGKNYRSDSRRGLGLGLALCQTILRVHDSKLTVSDNKPKGTVFSFVLQKGVVNVNE